MGLTREKQILVVEDEADMAEFLKERLQFAGYTVHTEASGKKGLSYAAEHQPDLVVLDLMLPDIHGYEVCKALHKLSTPWVLPILMLTAMAQPVDQLRGFAHGADAYLTKPFDSNELLKTVAMLLGDPVIASAEEEEDTHDVNG